MIYTKNVHLVFIPVPGTEILKTLEFPEMRVIKVSFVVSEMTFGKHIRLEAGC